MKSHESIKNTAIASIKRHSIDINQWDNTKIILSDYLQFIDRLDNELPITEFILNNSNWTIITTKRIVGQIDGKQNQIEFIDLDDVIYGDYKNIKIKTTIFRTIDIQGDSLDFLMETGKPSIAFIYSINPILRLYRNVPEPNMIDRDDDFIAILTYKSTEHGGRKTPAHSGYRPQVKFDFDEMQTSGQQTFIDKDVVYPGDTVEASIKILSVDHFTNSLTEGMDFEFREGNKIIGTGMIKKILNDKLKKASWQHRV
ncbi:MAG TPA: hypothetical protein DCE80_14745 [Ignavibacteriales bacterium]|nr:hypothetical protein [Ignavibacteriales bacterium]